MSDQDMIESLRIRVERYQRNTVAWVNCPLREVRSALEEIDRLRAELSVPHTQKR